MNLTLVRKECGPKGIFSELQDETGSVVFQTLEHSYDCKPKIYNGTFTCKRRVAQITHGETFEITGVEGHSDLLFHCGNKQEDSEGCILLGETRNGDMIWLSRVAFRAFMRMLEGVNEFQLTVK